VFLMALHGGARRRGVNKTVKR